MRLTKDDPLNQKVLKRYRRDYPRLRYEQPAERKTERVGDVITVRNKRGPLKSYRLKSGRLYAID